MMEKEVKDLLGEYQKKELPNGLFSKEVYEMFKDRQMESGRTLKELERHEQDGSILKLINATINNSL